MVLDTLPAYPGITHPNISVSWWILYHMMMFETEKGNIDPNSPYGTFLKLLRYIKCHKSKGINVHVKYIDNCTLYFGPHESFFSQTKNLFQCWNYTNE